MGGPRGSVGPYPGPGREPARCLARTAGSTRGREFWSQEDTEGHRWFDCAWSLGSRGQRRGYPEAPWSLAAHQGLGGQETL